MAVSGPVTEVMRAGGSHIPALLDRVEQRLADAAAGHGQLLAVHAGSTIAAGGKRLRPLLVFLAADAEDGEGLVRAAVAVELVHSATLVHDDLIDGARVRRGQPAAWAVHGDLAALATGDYLFARAFAELAATDDVDAVAAQGVELQDGPPGPRARGENRRRRRQHRALPLVARRHVHEHDQAQAVGLRHQHVRCG